MPYHEDHALETYKSLISISVEFLRSLLLLNGGAVVALLAYMGQASNGTEIARAASPSVSCFVLGLLLATIGFLGSYKTQLILYGESMNFGPPAGAHQKWLRVTFLISAGSVAAFGLGSFLGLNALAGA